MKDFIDALHIAVTVWLFFEWYKTQRRLDEAEKALVHIVTALFHQILGGEDLPEKKP